MLQYVSKFSRGGIILFVVQSHWNQSVPLFVLAVATDMAGLLLYVERNDDWAAQVWIKYRRSIFSTVDVNKKLNKKQKRIRN